MPRALYDQWGDDISRAILASAFAEPADDGPYMSHEWLMTLALRQGDEVRAVERRLDIIGWSVFVGGLLLFFGPLVLRGPLRWR
jgi:hypothetical protein